MGGVRLMNYERIEHEILSVEEVIGASGKVHVVRKGVALYGNLSISYDSGTLFVELREPVIEGTQWQGGIIADNRVVHVFVNDQDCGELELINGVGSIPIEFTVVGTYIIRVESALCQSAEIEVTI